MSLTKQEAKAIFAQVRDNLDRLKSCPRHVFLDFDKAGMGAKLGCNSCGGEMRITDVLHYARGYQAAGGNPEDVAPGCSAVMGGQDT